MVKDLDELHDLGKLAEAGYIKETYDKDLNDLSHKLTDKGLAEVKDMLKDRETRTIFKKMILEEAKGMTDKAKTVFIMNIMDILE
jgi:DNA-binding PadR family transcriptional regulator